MPTSAPATSAPNRALQIGLWVAQALLGLGFVMIGQAKLTAPIAELAKQAAWMSEMPWLVRFIGVSEVLGGIGVVLPAAVRVLPKLSGIAAGALVVVMVLAVGYHVAQHDTLGHAMPAVVFGALAAFVAWGRLVKAPIAPRG